MQDERLKEVVKSVLKNSDKNKNSYNSLLFSTWKALEYRVSVDIDDLFEMPSCEAIIRLARKLKEDDESLKGSDRTEERRKELEHQYRIDFSKKLKTEYPIISKYIRQ